MIYIHKLLKFKIVPLTKYQVYDNIYTYNILFFATDG